MSLFNLIWIAIFIYFGYNLTFVGFEGIDFKYWDEVVGILMLVCAAAGLFCVIKRAIDTVLGVTGRIKERSAYRAARKKLRSVPAKPDGFHEDFREDIISANAQPEEAAQPAKAQSVKEEPADAEPVQAEPVGEQPEHGAQPAAVPVGGAESMEESLRKLSRQYEIDEF